MKNKTVKALALLMTVTTVSMMGASSIYASDTETTTEAAAEETEAAGEESADADQQAADNVAALIDKIYVQERTETTDDDCKAAKEAWDALTDAQKELVEGENASPDYFGLDTGDATKDDARNAGSLSGLGRKKSIYCSDHYQPRSGKRRGSDRQHAAGS